MTRHRSLVLVLLLVIFHIFARPGLCVVQDLPIQVGKDKAIITIESFLDVMRNHADKVLWVDTRDQSEVAVDGTFHQAKVIPIGELKKEVNNLPSEKPIIFYCNTGARAGEAYDFLLMKRPEIKAYFLDAQLSFQKKEFPLVTPLK